MKTIVIFNKRDINNPTWGGGDAYVHEMAKGLARKYKVIIVTVGHKGLPPVDTIDGIEIHRVGMNVTIGRFLLPIYFLRHFGKADLVIDAVTVIPWFSPIFARGRKLLLFHQLVGDIFFDELPPVLAHAAFWLEPLLYKPYKHTPAVAVSPSSRDALAVLGISDSSLVNVVPPGISSSILMNGNGEHAKRDPIIVCLSRVVAYKGIQYAIMSMPIILKTVSNAELIVVGKGPYLAKLKELASKLGLANKISFAGYLREEQKIEILNKTRVLVFPSRREGWGINILEANALGVPAVGWNTPGIKDAIRDGETGFLVEEGRTELLAEKIITLLTNDICWQNMSQKAFVWANQHTWENTQAGINDVVGKLLGDQASK